jgi:hypothetical protein
MSIDRDAFRVVDRSPARGQRRSMMVAEMGAASVPADRPEAARITGCQKGGQALICKTLGMPAKRTFIPRS